MRHQKTKRKQVGEKERGLLLLTQNPQKGQKRWDTERECEQNSFEIIGNKTEKFLAFTSDRGKCNEMSNADTIKKKLNDYKQK